MTNTTKADLAEYIRVRLPELRRECFTPEYAANATDAETIGLVLARLFEWDGLEILDAAAAALEDANFHTEAGEIWEMRRKAAAAF